MLSADNILGQDPILSNSIISNYVPPIVITYEPETTAYLDAIAVPNDSTIYYPGTAYEIEGSAIWTALDLCVVEIKNTFALTLGIDNLNTKFKYIYPRIGGTSIAHSYNLVNALSNGTYLGGWVHNGSGALPNGTNGYFDTGIQYTASNFLPADSAYGFISKTDTAGLFCDVGVLSSGTPILLKYAKNASNLNSTRCNTITGNNTVAITTSLGLIAISRNNALTYSTYQNGLSLATFTDAAAITAGTNNIFECTFNSFGSPGGQYSPRKRTWSFAGAGINSTQMADFYTALNNFEIALNR